MATKRSTKKASRSRQRDRARGAAGQIGDTNAFEEAMKAQVESWKNALKKTQELPNGRYVGLIGDVRVMVKKKIPMVTLNITTLTGEESGVEFQGVPVTLFYRLANPNNPDNNWGLDRLIKELVAIGFELEQLQNSSKLIDIVKALHDSDDTYVAFTAKTKAGESGEQYANYFISSLVDPEVLGLL